MTILDYVELYAKDNPYATAFQNENQCITYGGLNRILINLQHMDHGYSNQVVLLKSERVLDFMIALLFLLSENCRVVPVSHEIKDLEIKDLMLGIYYVDFNYNIMDIDSLSLIYRQGGELRKPNETKAAIYHATSGSTGKSKLCIRTLFNLTREGLSYRECLQLMPSDKIVSLCPLYHSYALGAALMGTLVSGCSLYLEDKLSPRRAIRNIIKNEITIIILVPAIAKLMCEVKRKEKQPLSTVRFALAGAGVVDSQLFQNFYMEFGIYLHGNYGSTETGGLLTRLSEKIYPSIGKPMEGVQIKIKSNDQHDASGELYVKAEGMFQGYVNQQGEVFDSEGYFSMGDYVSEDSKGNLYYIGRKKNIINIGGKKIAPEEVEDVIRGFQGVKECVVIESQRRNNNHIVVAFIVANYEDSKGLYHHCIDHLSPYKIPSVFHFIDKIPMNEVGKVKFNELKKMSEVEKNDKEN